MGDGERRLDGTCSCTYQGQFYSEQILAVTAGQQIICYLIYHESLRRERDLWDVSPQDTKATWKMYGLVNISSPLLLLHLKWKTYLDLALMSTFPWLKTLTQTRTLPGERCNVSAFGRSTDIRKRSTEFQKTRRRWSCLSVYFINIR